MFHVIYNQERLRRGQRVNSAKPNKSSDEILPVESWFSGFTQIRYIDIYFDTWKNCKYFELPFDQSDFKHCPLHFLTTYLDKNFCFAC